MHLRIKLTFIILGTGIAAHIASGKLRLHAFWGFDHYGWIPFGFGIVFEHIFLKNGKRYSHKKVDDQTRPSSHEKVSAVDKKHIDEILDKLDIN